MPGGNSGRPLISAVSSRTVARSVIVTGFGGFLPPWLSPRSIEIVTALAAAGTFSLAGRAGCQVTCGVDPDGGLVAVLHRRDRPARASRARRECRAATRVSVQVVNPGPEPVTGARGREPVRHGAWPPTRARSAARPARSTTRPCPPGRASLVSGARVLSTPFSTVGAAESCRAPVGTANEARIAFGVRHRPLVRGRAPPVRATWRRSGGPRSTRSGAGRVGRGARSRIRTARPRPRRRGRATRAGGGGACAKSHATWTAAGRRGCLLAPGRA